MHRCKNCKTSLRDVEIADHETRQVFDIPPLKVEITEHRAEQKICPCCSELNTADFPNEVVQPTQYGTTIKGLATYLNQYQLLPYARLRQFFADILGHSISEGMLVKINQQCYENLEAVDLVIKRQLQASGQLHHDESGIRANGNFARVPWPINS